MIVVDVDSLIVVAFGCGGKSSGRDLERPVEDLSVTGDRKVIRTIIEGEDDLKGL